MKLALLAFSPISRLACRTKDVLYRHGILKARKAPLPTISVGNLSFGGTEKTPLAMELIAHLVRMGHRPAFVSRGYRGSWERTGGILSDGTALLGTWKEGGDEPFMVAKRFPKAGVFVGKDRLASCLKAREMGFTAIVLDDAFQHRRLARDLDIVLVNPAEARPLREGARGAPPRRTSSSSGRAATLESRADQGFVSARGCLRILRRPPAIWSTPGPRIRSRPKPSLRATHRRLLRHRRTTALPLPLEGTRRGRRRVPRLPGPSPLPARLPEKDLRRVHQRPGARYDRHDGEGHLEAHALRQVREEFAIPAGTRISTACPSCSSGSGSRSKPASSERVESACDEAGAAARRPE